MRAIWQALDGRKTWIGVAIAVLVALNETLGKVAGWTLFPTEWTGTLLIWANAALGVGIGHKVEKAKAAGQHGWEAYNSLVKAAGELRELLRERR